METRVARRADERAATPRSEAETVHDAAEPLTALWLRSRAAANERVSPSQLRALLIVGREGPLPVTQLADGLGAMVSSASRLCDRLVAAGLVERQPSPVNRRQTLVQLSRSGGRLLAEIRAARIAEVEALLSPLSSNERTGLLRGLLALSQVDERDSEVCTEA